MSIINLFDKKYKLPDLLKKEELIELFQELKNGNIEAREKLLLHNLKLVKYIVTKGFYNVKIEKEELFSIGTMGLIKAIDTYNLEKQIEFSSYASTCITNEILMFLRQRKKDLKTCSYEDLIGNQNDDSKDKLNYFDTLDDDKDFTLEIENQEVLEILRGIINELEDRDKKIIMWRFGFYDGELHTEKDIAAKMNISRSYVSRIIKRNLKLLQIKLSEMGIVNDRFIPINDNDDNNQLSIYEYFIKFSTEQINYMLSVLDDEELREVKLEFGNDFLGTNPSKLSKEQRNLFYKQLGPKMTKIMLGHDYQTETMRKKHKKKKQAEFYENKKDSEKNNGDTNLDLVLDKQEPKCNIMLDWQDIPMLKEFINSLDIKESIIFLLRYGFVNDKQYNIDDIADFFNINSLEVITIIKNVLQKYKSYINNIFITLTDDFVLK